MPSWLLLLLPLIVKLIEWLISRQQKGEKLNARQKKRLNTVIARSRELETAACALGCKAGGVSDPDEEATMLAEAGH